jgi:hypothetical protein
MRLVLTLLLLMAATQASLAGGSETSGSAERAARFYAAGLQAPLLQIRAGTQIVATCQKRFRAQCSERHRQAADKARLTLDYLDALTLFPERLPFDPAANLKSYDDVKAGLDAVNELLMNAVREYDRALFARYGATLRECQPDNIDLYRGSLHALEDLEFDMLGVGSIDERERVRQSIDGEEVSLARRIHAEWPDGDCAAASRIGEFLMEMTFAKLQPWRTEPGAPLKTGFPDADETRGIASEFLFQAAAELEVIVNPSMRAKLLAISKRLPAEEPAQPEKPEKPGLEMRGP